MQLILLSGGSGTRLWPLSNDARSKQFLRILDKEGSSEKESLVQRVMRQIRESGIEADITVATSNTQVDSVLSQLGNQVNIVAEPSRRDTFPAICLACNYLSKEKKCDPDETVVVMPCDPYTELGYFETIKRMAEGVRTSSYELIVMGITPTYPSAKYGYVLPNQGSYSNGIESVREFIEKPEVKVAEMLISKGALWNGGVFAFRLGYLMDISDRYLDTGSFIDTLANYERFPKISFDYEVAEKADNIGMIEYRGEWKDLGTWNTLTDELREYTYGNVTTDGSHKHTHIINELDIPVMCIGTTDLIIAASHDGILVSEKVKSENIKELAASIKTRPMYEERRWGTYRVVDFTETPNGFKSLTKRLKLNPGASISYQRHFHRSEVWTFVDGEGEIVIGTDRHKVQRGDTVSIPQGTLHSLRAITPLTFIEVQSGDLLEENDIERLKYSWE